MPTSSRVIRGSTTIDELARFYAAPSLTSDLARHAGALQSFPGTPEAAYRWARNAVLHVVEIPRWGVELAPGRMQDVNTRSAARIVDRILALNAASLSALRRPEERMVGNCHHLALLACALLRHSGIPVRIRIGFAPYIKRGYYEDHCVCEVFLSEAWHRFDPAFGLGVGDELLRTFVTGGEAWLQHRSGETDPDLFGADDLFEPVEWRGWWYIRNSVVRDFAALCKFELHPWDWWGLMLMTS